MSLPRKKILEITGLFWADFRLLKVFPGGAFIKRDRFESVLQIVNTEMVF
jgi:hypothetical protein